MDISDIRRIITEEPQVILEKAIAFSEYYLRWARNPNKKIILQVINQDTWNNRWNDDLLAHEIEVIDLDDGSEGYIINVNSEKLGNEDEQFVARFTFVLIHEILEIYKQQTGIPRILRINPPTFEIPTKFEIEMWQSFLEKEFKIPTTISQAYGWLS